MLDHPTIEALKATAPESPLPWRGLYDVFDANGFTVAWRVLEPDAAHIAAAVNAAPHLLAENARLAGELLLRDAGERTGSAMFASWVFMECKKAGVENDLGSVPVLIEKCGTMKRELDVLEREREGFKSARAEDYTIKNNLLARVAELEGNLSAQAKRAGLPVEQLRAADLAEHLADRVLELEAALEAARVAVGKITIWDVDDHHCIDYTIIAKDGRCERCDAVHGLAAARLVLGLEVTK